MSLSVSPFLEQFAPVTSIVEVRWAMPPQSPSLWVGHRGALSATVAKSTVPQQAVQGTEPQPRQLTSVEVIQLAIMWRVSRQALGLPDVDHLLASLMAPQHLFVSDTDRQLNESPKKKMTTSTVIDQQTKPMSNCQQISVDIYFQNHIYTEGDEPMQDAALSQIAAAERQFANGDFTVLTLFCRRMKRMMTLRNCSKMAFSKPSTCQESRKVVTCATSDA